MREDVALSAKVHCYRLRMFRGEMDVGVCPVYLAHAPLLGRFTVSERGHSPETYCVASGGIDRSAHLWYVMPRGALAGTTLTREIRTRPQHRDRAAQPLPQRR